MDPTKALVRPVRVPEHVALGIADPPIARAGETGTWKPTFTLTEDVPEGTDLRVLFHGGRNVKGLFSPLQVTDAQAEGYVRAARQDGTAIPTDCDNSSGGEVALAVPKGGLARGETIVVWMGEGPGIRAPRESLSNKMFLLFRPEPEADTSVPQINAEPGRTIVGACLIHVTGNALARIRAYAPSQARPGERLSILIRPEDVHGNVACEEPGGLLARLDGEELQVQRVPVTGTTCCRLEGIELPQPGIHRIEVEDTSNRLTAICNPIRVLPEAPEMDVQWGYIHGHTELSDGAGTLDNYFTYMRDTCGLDFGALGDHDHAYETSEEMWRMAQKATARYHEPGRFVTFLGYEWAKWRRNGDGDRNVYYLEDNRPMYRSDDGHYPNPPALFEALKNETAIVIPHHPAEIGNHCDYKDHDPEADRLIEIYSVWGNSERSVNDGNPYPVRFPQRTPESPVDAGEAPAGFVQRALELGWRVGFTGGGDDHSGHPGDDRGKLQPWSYKGGLLGVHAPERTREAIWDALWNRHCYATTGARIIVEFSVSGAPMGSELSLGERPELAKQRTIRATVHGAAPIERIEVVRNNEDVHVHEGSGMDEALEWADDESFDDIALPPAQYCATPF